MLRSKAGYIEALKSLEDVDWQLKYNIVDDFYNQYLNSTPDYHFEKDKDMSKKYASFWFSKENWDKYGLQICFQFDGNGYNSFFYGIAKKSSEFSIPENLKKRCQQFGFVSTDWWAGWKWMENPYLNWSLSTFSLLNENPKELALKMLDITKELEVILDQFVGSL